MKKVFYAPRIDDYHHPYDHPILDEVAFIEPVSFLEYFADRHEKHTYWKCPAWKKYYKNSYVFFSQFDMKIKYDKLTGILDDDSFKYFSFDEAAGARQEGFLFNQPKEEPPINPYNGVAVGQSHQHLVFWPEQKKQKNLWLEILPIPDMIKTHDAELISGEYPFSRWFRPSLFAFKFHKELTKFKRGEPLGIIKFKNLDNYQEDIKLERQEIPKEIEKRSNNHTFLKIFLPNQSWNLIKENPKLSCPFKKFWKS